VDFEGISLTVGRDGGPGLLRSKFWCWTNGLWRVGSFEEPFEEDVCVLKSRFF
jgi:hypothetical protein